jgi:hypothetical protein
LNQSKPIETVPEEKYEEMPNKVDPASLEVASDYSYDEEKDEDKPECTKAVKHRIEIVEKEGKRKMYIRKQYFLEDGRELRVKCIWDVRQRQNEENQEESNKEGENKLE